MACAINKVLISDEIDEKCMDVFRANGIEVTKNTKLSKDQLIQEIVNYDGLIVRSATKVSADVINAGSRLKIIGRAGTGVDNIDTTAATKHGVVVMNTPGGNTLSAAELTCAMILAVSRHVASGCASVKANLWERKAFMGSEVFGKTLAIVGLGRIGKEVATRMQSFGMTTIGYDPITPAEVAASWGVQWMTLEEVWKNADYITVHTPLIPQTKNLINAEVLGKCRPGVRIINCARGGIVDEQALLESIQKGHCGGAGLDVFVEEPPTNCPILNEPRITCTPHLGASTNEAQSRVAVEIAEQFVDFKNGKSLFGAINAPALSSALSPTTQPYVQLGTCLGKMAAALSTASGDATNQLKIVTQGECMKQAKNYMGVAVLVGILQQSTGNGVNLVSAQTLAKDKGITLVQEHRDGDVAEVIIEGLVSGTVLGGRAAVTAVAGSKLSQPMILQGNVLVYKGGKLAEIAGAVQSQGSRVEALATDATGAGVMQVAPPVANLETIRALVDSIVQLAF